MRGRRNERGNEEVEMNVGRERRAREREVVKFHGGVVSEGFGKKKQERNVRRRRGKIAAAGVDS